MTKDEYKELVSNMGNGALYAEHNSNRSALQKAEYELQCARERYETSRVETTYRDHVCNECDTEWDEAPNDRDMISCPNCYRDYVI